MIFEKSFETIETETDERLQQAGFITTPGSIAKLFASIINSSIADFYQALITKHKNAFISTARGKFIDAIGLLLNCKRNIDESDQDYKYRIINQILIVASSNETAIRLAALQVTGVADVYIKKYSHGAGTFTVVVLSDNTVDSTILLSNVKAAVDKVEACGEKSYICEPNDKYISMNIKINFKQQLDDITENDIKQIVKENVTKYINSIGLGGTLIFDEITKCIMNTSSYISSYIVTKFEIDKEQSQLINQQTGWYERFRKTPDPEAIKVN